MDLIYSTNDLAFLDSEIPPRIVIFNSHWTQSISTDAEIAQLFSASLIRALSEGRPQPAEQVLQLLLHWIKHQGDPTVIRQTYAMRLRLDAFVYQYAMQQQTVDTYAWKSLGTCSIGRKIAIKLNTNLALDDSVPWTITTLWDWITTEVDSEAFVACTVGMVAPEFRLCFQMGNLKRSVFVVFVSGAYLWPPSFPVMDNDTLTSNLDLSSDVSYLQPLSDAPPEADAALHR